MSVERKILSPAQARPKIDAELARLHELAEPFAIRTKGQRARIALKKELGVVCAEAKPEEPIPQSGMRKLDLLAAEIPPDSRPQLTDLSSDTGVNIAAFEEIKVVVAEGFADDANWMIDAGVARKGAIERSEQLIGYLPDEGEAQGYRDRLSVQRSIVVGQVADLPTPTKRARIVALWESEPGSVIERKAIIDPDIDNYVDDPK